MEVEIDILPDKVYKTINGYTWCGAIEDNDITIDEIINNNDWIREGILDTIINRIYNVMNEECQYYKRFHIEYKIRSPLGLKHSIYKKFHDNIRVICTIGNKCFKFIHKSIWVYVIDYLMEFIDNHENLSENIKDDLNQYLRENKIIYN